MMLSDFGSLNTLSSNAWQGFDVIVKWGDLCARTDMVRGRCSHTIMGGQGDHDVLLAMYGSYHLGNHIGLYV